MRRLLTAFALLCGPADGAVTLLGRTAVPLTASDASGLNDKVGGIPHNRLGSLGSGIDYSGTGTTYYCVADRGPQDGKVNYRCRFHTIRLAFTPVVRADLVGTTMLTFHDGSPLVGLAADFSTGDVSGRTTSRRFDPEGVRVDARRASLYVCEEYGPRIGVFSLAGNLVAVWNAPTGFQVSAPAGDPVAERKDQATGRYPNQGFEGLTTTPGGLVYAVMQGALIQDSAGGERLGPDDRDVRVVAFDPADGAVKAQYLYRLEAPASGATRPFGVSEILAISDTDFLFLERDGSERAMRRIYRASINGATAITEPGARGVTPMTKQPTPFIDLMDPSFGLAPDMPPKIEGMTFGPDLPDGQRTLVVTTDNDFEKDPTWFWVFAFRDADLAGPAGR